MAELLFNSDTKHRKQWFTGLSFSHPAKMSLPLQIWIIENYTKEGEVILDPMAGSGTAMVGCSMGRDVIVMDLEQKFVDMMNSNWEKIRQRGCQLGYSMGRCQIIQGDARNLEGVLADKIITSPPYSDSPIGGGLNTKPPREGMKDQSGRSPGSPSQTGAGGYADKIITSPPYSGGIDNRDRSGEPHYDEERDKKFAGGSRSSIMKPYSSDKGNIGNLPYGAIDKIVSSPPFGEAQSGGGIAQKGYQGNKHSPTDLVGKRSYMPENIGDDPSNIGNLSYGEIDKIITSPPYEAFGASREGEKIRTGQSKIHKEKSLPTTYTMEQTENIGNKQGQSYLETMLHVYQQCYSVLKIGGLMILVTKNFIRNKQVVRLDTDTIKLCEQAGFTFIERHYRKLPAQSFWRVIYHQKFPDVEQIDKEDVLVFRKAEL